MREVLEMYSVWRMQDISPIENRDISCPPELVFRPKCPGDDARVMIPVDDTGRWCQVPDSIAMRELPPSAIAT